MPLSDIISHCVQKWRAEGIELATPVAESEIRGVWHEFKSPVSDDVLALYTTVGGFAEYTFDGDFFWSLWPWDWLQQRNHEEPSAGIKFCDHSIEIVTWELRYENERTSSVWSSHGDKTSPSLESFLECYLTNPWELY